MDKQREKVLEFLKKTSKKKLFLYIFFICFFCSILPVGILSGLYSVPGAVYCLLVCCLPCAVIAWVLAVCLHRGVQLLLAQDKDITAQLRTVSKNARQHVLLQLLQRNTTREEKIHWQLEQSGIEFLQPYYCVAVIKLDDFWLASEEYSDRDIVLFKFSMANIAVELLNEHMAAYSVENGIAWGSVIS